MAEGLILSADRVKVGLEACWEVEALCVCVRDLAAAAGRSGVDQVELVRLSLQVRGIASRVETLAGALMSILDDDDDTENLQKKVLGEEQAV